MMTKESQNLLFSYWASFEFKQHPVQPAIRSGVLPTLHSCASGVPLCAVVGSAKQKTIMNWRGVTNLFIWKSIQHSDSYLFLLEP